MNKKLIEYFYKRMQNGETAADIDKDIVAAMNEAAKQRANDGHKEEMAQAIIDAYNAYCAKFAPELQVEIKPSAVINVIDKNCAGLTEAMDTMKTIGERAAKMSKDLDEKIASSKSLFDLVKGSI